MGRGYSGRRHSRRQGDAENPDNSRYEQQPDQSAGYFIDDQGERFGGTAHPRGLIEA